MSNVMKQIPANIKKISSAGCIALKEEEGTAYHPVDRALRITQQSMFLNLYSVLHCHITRCLYGFRCDPQRAALQCAVPVDVEGCVQSDSEPRRSA